MSKLLFGVSLFNGVLGASSLYKQSGCIYFSIKFLNLVESFPYNLITLLEWILNDKSNLFLNTFKIIFKSSFEKQLVLIA